MAMNKQRRTSNINNIVTYDTLKNVTVPANLTVQGLTQAGFVKSDGNGLFSVDTTVYQAAGTSSNIYTTNGTLAGNRVVSMASNTLSFNGGNVSIGNTLPLSLLHVGDRSVTNSSNPVILISRNVTNSFLTNTHAFSDSSLLTLGVGLAYNSYDARVDIGGSNNIDHYAAFQQGITVNSSATITNVYGLFTNTTITAGTITNNYGVYAYNPTGAGTITNNYGVYVDNLIKGGSNYGVYTNVSSSASNWNIYSAGSANNYFNGSVGIGIAPSTYKFDVQGTSRFSNNVTVTPVNGGTIYLGLSNYVTRFSDNGGYTRISIAQNGISNNSTFIGGGNGAGASISLDTTGVYFNYPANQTTANTWSFSRPFASASVNTTLLSITNSSTNAFTTTNTLTGIYINPDTQYWARIIAFQNIAGDVLLNTTSGSTIIGGTSINSSAKLQVDSTSKGFLPPRMTNAQRSAISSPSTGLIVYQTDSSEGLYQYKSTGWEAIGGAVSGVTSFNTRTGAITLLSSDVTTALGFTPISNNVYTSSGTLTGHRVIYGGSAWTFTIQDINTFTVDSTSVTNNVASFKATEPNVVIQAMGATNGAALFLNPSNSGINGSIHNRTGGGLEFYVGSTPAVKQTIKATGQIQFNGYTSTGSFSGTAAGYLGFDSSGNIITTTGVGGITLTTTGSSGAATWNGTTLNIPIYSGGGGGSVTTVSVVSANGFAGTVANDTSTPAITLTTTISGILKGNSTSISAATAGLDYQAPITLTTTGTTANATFSSNTLNIPNYALSNLYNANGTLSGNRTITSGGFTLAIGSRVSIGTTTAPSSIFDLAVNGLTDTGGLSIRGTTFTASATATFDRGLYVYGGTGTATLTLLDSLNHNSVLFIKNNSASVLTVAAATSRFIQLKNGTNVSTYALASNDTIILISNGLNHYVQI